ncbi:MAG: hypothetical protein ACXWIX_11545, partial [Croceibacterium sp.]
MVALLSSGKSPGERVGKALVPRCPTNRGGVRASRMMPTVDDEKDPFDAIVDAPFDSALSERYL